VFKQAWQLYTEIVEPANPTEFFKEHGLGIQAYTGLASVCITYLQAILASITSNNYAQSDLADWLKKEIDLLDAAVDGAAKHFADHMSTVSSDLANNFMTIKTKYHQRKAQLVLAWLEPLFDQLATQYPLSSAHTKRTTGLSLHSIETYTQLLFVSAAVFSAKQPLTTLGKYTTVMDLITAFSNRLADLFLYQAELLQLNITYSCGDNLESHLLSRK
jgi:hypothetical protein